MTTIEKVINLIHDSLQKDLQPLGFLVEAAFDHNEIHIFDVTTKPAQLWVIGVKSTATGPFTTR